MTKERRFYIAYRIVKFIANLETQPSYEPHEFCMYVAELENALRLAMEYRNVGMKFLQPYYKRLNEELECLQDTDWFEEVKELIELLDEWRLYI